MYILNSSCQNFFKTYSKFYETAQSLSDITYSLSFPHCLDSKLLVLSRFSRVRLCVIPQMAATRLPHPWDSPGKNTGVGCHFLLQCMKVKSESEVAQSCPTLINPLDCSLPGSSVHGFSRQEYWSGVPSPSPTVRKGQICMIPFI